MNKQQTIARTRRETVCRATRELHVLMIEDNPMNQQAIGSMVDGMGHEVAIADDAEAGIDLARTGHYDLVLMDIQLPGMDGMEATRELRAHPGAVDTHRIIAISSDADEHHRTAYSEAGMDDCVEKPIKAGMLAAAIDRVIGEPLHNISDRDVVMSDAEIAREDAEQKAAVNRETEIASFLAQLEAMSTATGEREGG